VDGVDEAFGRWLRAALIVLLACVVLAVIVPSAITVWAKRSNRTRLWLVFLLAFVGVVTAEVCAIIAFLVLNGETSSDWAVVLFGVVSIASFIGVAERPRRTA
jgi:hypothetical protein